MNKSNYKGKKALLVDDDIDILGQLEIQMKSLGFEVVTAENQAEGEKLIEEEDYDVALFDLMMENQDSGFILSYKSKKKNPQVPIIMITSVTGETGLEFNSSTEENRSWIKADVVLDKDIRFEQLQSELERLLG